MTVLRWLRFTQSPRIPPDSMTRSKKVGSCSDGARSPCWCWLRRVRHAWTGPEGASVRRNRSDLTNGCSMPCSKPSAMRPRRYCMRADQPMTVDHFPVHLILQTAIRDEILSRSLIREEVALDDPAAARGRSRDNSKVRLPRYRQMVGHWKAGWRSLPGRAHAGAFVVVTYLGQWTATRMRLLVKHVLGLRDASLASEGTAAFTVLRSAQMPRPSSCIAPKETAGSCLPTANLILPFWASEVLSS